MVSKLQVISGRFRGKKLCIPPCSRPTQQKARGAVFNMLAEIVGDGAGWLVWDAFAGSGAMGIEFISRFGATKAIFTDPDADAIECIRKNTDGIDGCEVIRVGADNIRPSVFTKMHAEPTAGGYYPPLRMVVFIDPPYDRPELGGKLMARLSNDAPTGTIVVWEVEKPSAPPPFSRIPNGWRVLKDKTYGRARFLILEKAE